MTCNDRASHLVHSFLLFLPSAHLHRRRCLSSSLWCTGPHRTSDNAFSRPKDMTSYPTALAPQLNQVPEDTVPGQITPSHGGMIGGHEFDMSITQPTPAQQQQAQPATPTNTNTLPAPVPRPASTNSHRPRPVSMPPQAFAPPPQTTSATRDARTSPTEAKERSQPSADENKERRRHKDERSYRSNRILGDYTLSKTLGAGSMGKVKLATHNITGEKVRALPSHLLFFI